MKWLFQGLGTAKEVLGIENVTIIGVLLVVCGILGFVVRYLFKQNKDLQEKRLDESKEYIQEYQKTQEDTKTALQGLTEFIKAQLWNKKGWNTKPK